MIIHTDQATAQLDFQKVDIVDAEVIEDVFGTSFDEWIGRVVGKAARPTAKDLRAFLFLARRQSGEAALKFDEVHFQLGSLDFAYTPAEQAEIDKKKAIEAAATGEDGSVDPTLPVSSETVQVLDSAALATTGS